MTSDREKVEAVLTHLRLSRVDALVRIDRGDMPDYNAGWRDALDMAIVMLESITDTQNI